MNVRIYYTATNFLPAERSGKQEPERPPRNNDRETQLVKPSSPAAALDKYIIKGPMAKVVRETSAAAAPLGRMLM
jgi:hypothetical protein